MNAINLGTLYAGLELRLDHMERQQAQANASFDKLGKDLSRKADKIKQDLGQKFGDLGRTLTLGITAPLAALGTAAVKAAVEMDSLKRGLRAVAGSAEETERQLKRLKEVAKLPGLGFEEAVRGSINLQAAGMSARQAERALAGFGNALATVGKGKADLDGVTLALTQIAAKGKVSAEEINQLQERVPQIRQIMKDAFGTADTEVLQKAKIGATEFLDAVISRLEKMPRVTGGAQNSFENFSDAAKQALSKIGDVFLPAVTKALEAITPIVEKIGNAFKELPGPVQTALGGLALGGVIIGPALMGLGTFIKTIGSLKASILGLQTSGALGILGRIGLWGSVAAAGGYGVKAILDQNMEESDAIRRGNEVPDVTVELNKRAELRRKLKTMRERPWGDKEDWANEIRMTEARIKSLTDAINKRVKPIKYDNVTGQAKPDAPKGGIIDAAARAEAEARKKQAAEDAKRAAEERKEALKQLAVDMATFKDKFKGMRVKAFQDFQELAGKVGSPKASPWYKARLDEIDKEEDDERKRIAEGHKRRLEQMKRDEEEIGRERAKMRTEIAKREKEAVADIVQLADDLGALEAEKQRRAKNLAAYWLGMFNRARDIASEALANFKITDLLPDEARVKPVTPVEDDWTNPTAGQDTEANVRMHGPTAQEEAREKKARDRERMLRLRDRMRNSFGGIFAASLADEFASGFARRLEKVFGNNSFGRAISRALDRWLQRTLDTALDNLFAGIGKAIEGRGKQSTVPAPMQSFTTMPGSQGGPWGGAQMPGDWGKAGQYLQYAQMAQGIAQGKKPSWSQLGTGAGLAFGGPVGAGVGMVVGGIMDMFGFKLADGGTAPGRKISLVGERGPELIMPKSDMTVIPNHALGGNTYHMGGITVNAQVANDYDVYRMVDTVERELARRMERKQYARVARK